jgi:hypothetical protein
MPTRPLSFRPPPIAIDADLEWVVRGAFADVANLGAPNDPQRALQIARETQLSGRLAARLGYFQEGAPASVLAQELSADYYVNVATETLLTQAQQRIGELAERLAIPLIAVKFGGLRLSGLISVGSREVSDLDVLAPTARARELWHAMLAAGFRRTNTREYSHQLEALVDPDGAVIDLHVHLPGVVVARGTFATAEQLLARGLLVRTNGSILVPRADVLAAHAIAHALVQNRSTPQTYSPLRLLADLMDIQRAEAHVVSNAASYLAPAIAITCASLERLCACLAKGAIRGPNFEGTSEQILFCHCLAARLDFDYAEGLRAGGLAHKFRDGSSVVEIARYIADLIYPSEWALDSLYGPVTGSMAHVRRRLRRPLDLVIRAARRSLRSHGR